MKEPELGAFPEKPERVEPPKLGPNKSETRDCQIKPQAWVCPFCGRDNGIPEVDVCACGAERKGATANK